MISKLNNKGFTIVEVLIVLAIAGVILATILLAVPALQRNSRNTQVKQAATSLVAGAQESAAANSGKAPTGISAAGAWTQTGGASTTTTVAGGVTINTAGTVPGTISARTVYPVFGALCLGITATTAGASASNIAVVYAVENGGTPTSACVQG